MIIRKPAFDRFSFVKFYAKNTTSGIDIGYKKGPKTMVHNSHRPSFSWVKFIER